MHLPDLSPRRLTAAAAIACAAALTPAAALAVTAGPASTPACATSGLVVWMNTQGGGYAGGTGYTLEFTNLSGHACTLYGDPGVSAVNLGGRQLGRPAAWENIPRHVVRLANGATATAVLLITETGDFGGPGLPCAPVTAAGLRIYPPNQTRSKVVPFPFSACSHAGPVYLHVEPVTKA